MNAKRLLLAVTVLFFCLSGLAQAANSLTVLGRSPFHKPPLASVEDLKAMLQTKNDEIRAGFALAGYPELYDGFAAQVAASAVESRQYTKGSTFQWMFYKYQGKGKVKILKDITWDGKEPFTGYQLTVLHNGREYTFVTPLACGNISLMKVTDVPVITRTPNREPACSATITPARAYCGETITIDASHSADTDGSVVGMRVSVLDAKGTVISEQKEQSLVQQMEMPCGSNTVKVTVIDNQGAEASSPGCEIATVGTSRNRFVADVGYYKQFDPGDYLFVRGGIEHRFSEQFSVLGMFGISPYLKGQDGDSAMLLDILANYDWNPVFASFGIGGWLSAGDSDLDSEDSGLDLIADVGTRVYGEPEAFNASLFVEARAAVDELDDIIKYGRFGIGIRCRF